jgi:hypothetical protein
MNIKNKFATFLLVFSGSFSVNAATCPPFAEEIVISSVAATEAALKQLQEFLFKNLSSQMESFDKLQLAATKTLTSQVATAAKAQINANVALKQGEMTALAHLESVKRQREIFTNHSALTGQGSDPCGQLVAQSNVTLASGQAAAMAADSLSHVAAAPGRYGDPERFFNNMAAQRRMYLTDDEAKLGFGKANTEAVTSANGARFSLAGADTNAGVLFVDSADPRIKAAKDAYLNHIAGAPDIPLTAEMANSPAGKEYLALKARKDATMSVALNSIAMVGAENTPNPEIGKSKIQALKDMVGKYYGKGAKDTWLDWTSQSQRGLMVDQLKIEAAILAVEVDQYQQSQRMEALLGSLLALEAQREYKPALNAAAQSIDSSKARPGVR